MVVIHNVNTPLNTDFSKLKPFFAKTLNISSQDIKSVKLHKKSVDARRKDDVHFCCSFLIDGNDSVILKKAKKYSASIYKEKNISWPKKRVLSGKRPIIVGFGPAGMFAALTLAYAGLCPIIIERGASADERKKEIESFWSGNVLNCDNNVQFGEGGAGTFSDGKLNTGIKNKNIKKVLYTFTEHGANEDILYESKPHIGTDILINVVKSIREEIISLGGEILFNTKLQKINIKDSKINSVIANEKEIPCDTVILAIGHSARDTFEMLYESNINMQPKPFAVGCRIEHLQKDINKSQYGEFANNPNLKNADYKLVTHLESGRGVFTFCMCPGGYVVNASSEKDGVAVNGMSYQKRDNINANSAVLVGVNPEDFDGEHPLRGMYFQREIEKKVYAVTNSHRAISTKFGDFLNHSITTEFGNIKPTVKPKPICDNVYKIYPDFITDSLRQGILQLDKKLKGFADENAVLTFPETRTSSPVRIVRNEFFESNIKGLYPCGEGAGYAGGITSAAVDGITVAEAVLERRD